MVEIRTPSLAPAVRPAGQVSNEQARDLRNLAGATQDAANRYSAYHEQKAADNAELIFAQANADWTRKFNETSRDASDGYAELTLQEFDAYVTDTMLTVPERQRDNMQHNFAQMRINMETKALQAEAAARARRRAEQKAEAQRQRELAIISDPSFGNFAVTTMNLDEAQTRRTFGVYAEAILRSDNREQIELLRDQLENQNVFDDFITADQKLTLMGNIDRAEDGFAREDAEDIDQLISDITANALNSGDVPAADMDLALEEIEYSYLDDATKAEARTALREQVDTAKALYDVRDIPVGESAANLREMRANAKTEAEWDQVNAYQRAVNSHTTALSQDQAGYVQSTAYGAADEFATMQSAETPEARAEAAQAYIWRMDDQYHKMGIPVARRTYLPEGTAESMALGFNESATGLTGAQLEMYLSTWGENSGRIQQELMAAGLDDTVAAQLWRSGDPVLNQMLATTKGSDLREVKAQFTSGDQTSAYNDLETHVYDYIQDYATAFSAGRGAEAQEFVRDMARVAIDTIMVHETNGGSMDRNSILDRFFIEQALVSDHAAMITPPGVDAGEIERNTNAMLLFKSRDLADQLDPNLVAQMTGVDDARVDKEVMASVLRSNGMFVLNDKGDGVRFGYNMNGQFVPFNVEYTFDELRTNLARESRYIATITEEPIAGTVVDPSVGPGDSVYAEPGTVVLRSQAPELEYSSEDPYYEEDLAAGRFRPGQAVILDGKTIIPVPE